MTRNFIICMIFGFIAGSSIASFATLNSRLLSINYKLVKANLELKEIKERLQ